MKSKLKLAKILCPLIMISMLYGCSKSNEVKPTEQQPTLPLTADGKHVYGLLPTTPDMYATLPVYSPAAFRSQLNDFSVTPAPAVLTLLKPAVRDQGSLGSCSAFCGTEAYEILYRYKHGAFPAVMSPAFLYYEERVNISGRNIAEDNGAAMVAIGMALDKYGICTEALYTYPNSDLSTAYKTPPTATAVTNASNYKTTGYTLINSGDTAAVKNCLRHNIPVMMGFNIYDNAKTYQYFENLNKSNYTYNPLTSGGAIINGLSFLGGHATLIVGYNDNLKAFLIENSWGTAWGATGYFYMPYSVFKNSSIVPQGYVYYAVI